LLVRIALLSTLSSLPFLFSFHDSLHHRALPSFPTRRSSDLILDSAEGPFGLRNVRELVAALEFAAVQRARYLSDPAFVEVPIVADRKSTRLNSSHVSISYAVFCLKKKKKRERTILDFHLKYV